MGRAGWGTVEVAFPEPPVWQHFAVSWWQEEPAAGRTGALDQGSLKLFSEWLTSA